MKPTHQVYSELQTAYDHFNKELFNGDLVDCIILLDNKGKRCLGYYCKQQFVSSSNEIFCDAIAMNPAHFGKRTIPEILSTLVHEMVHLWQAHLGHHQSKGRYHNKEWGTKMKSLGLMPSSSGEPGGKRTGQSMSHWIMEGGQFAEACDKLLTPEFRISWKENVSQDDQDDDGKGKNKSLRIKYTCPGCEANIWGKADLNVICGKCEDRFIAETEEDNINGETQS